MIRRTDIWRSLAERFSNCYRLRSSDRDSHFRWNAELEHLEDRIMLTAGNGLQAHYFDSPDLSGPALVRLDANIDFNWIAGSPDASIGNDSFSVRWSGEVEARFTETHSFIVNANDGARLWVNGRLLIDHFNSPSLTDETATIDLVAGRRYDIQLEFREDAGDAAVRLEWSSDSLTREVVPTDRLYAAQRSAVSVERWDGIAGTAVADLTVDPDFPDNADAISSLSSFTTVANQGDNYGQRIRGTLHAPQTGPYRFYIAGDEAAELWLGNSVDASGKLQIAAVDSPTAPQSWLDSPAQKSSVIYLVAGQTYYIEALHKESTGSDHLSVGWQRPGTAAIEVIPGEFLSPVTPTVKLFAESPLTSEDSTAPATVRVVRSDAPLNEALPVNYVVNPAQGESSATSGVDFTAPSGSITIPAGQRSALIEIFSLTDSDFEGSELLEIELVAATGYNVGRQSERRVIANILDDADAPAGGNTLLNGTGLSDFIVNGGTFSTVSDPTYGDLIQAEITTVPPNFYNAQVRQSNDFPINDGDIIWAEFYVRSIGGPGQLKVVFEHNGPPYTQSLEGGGVATTTDWTRVQIPFQSVEAYGVGEANFSFQIGYQLQTLQFRDIQLLNYGAPSRLHSEIGLYLNNLGGTFGGAQTVQVTGQSFTTAYEIETVTQPPDAWRLQAVTLSEGAVLDTQTMRVEFYARASAGATPRIETNVLRVLEGYTALDVNTFYPTSAWTLYSFDVVAEKDYPSGGLSLTFNVGFAPQTVEIADLTWTNLDQPIADLTGLPNRLLANSFAYGGRSGTDAWREQADDRIAAQRKSELTVNVVDVNGDPLDGALVHVQQQKHGFLFGSAINGFNGRLDANASAENLKYQSEILRLFSATVDEGAMQWYSMLDDRPRGSYATDFANAAGLYNRGHSGIWPGRSNMPDSVWAQYDSILASEGATAAADWLRLETSARITDIATEFVGRVEEWDVVNEPRTNNDVMQILGDQVLVDWFTLFKQLDPNVALTLNEYGIFSHNGNNTASRANYEYWIGLLDAAGAIDTIGEQSHYDNANLTAIDTLGQLIDTYYNLFDLPIAITELDVNTTDLQGQADYLRDYITMSFSQPGISKIMQWGFWEGRHWKPDAALYRRDFSIKPNGQAYEDLVFGEWWTDVRGTTVGGSTTTGAFHGDYEILVEYAGASYAGNVTVDDTGTASVTVNVPVVPVNYDPIVGSNSASVAGDVLTQLTNTGTWAETEGEAVALSASHGQVAQQVNGTWNWSYTPQQRYIDQLVTITATDARGGTTSTQFLISAHTNIMERGVSFGSSTGFSEDLMQTGKTALLPGRIATIANYTNYTLGLNRVIIHVAGLATTTLDNSVDFEFRVGNTGDPGDWLVLDANSSIPLPAVAVSQVAPGVDGIMLSWPDNAIRNSWVQVTLKANANTGLSSDDVFYFGNQVGDVFGATNPDEQVRVNSFDTGQTRLNQSVIAGSAGIGNVYDVNRDGRVNSFDTGLIRLNQAVVGGLLMLTAPAASPPSAPLTIFEPPGVVVGEVIGPQSLTPRQQAYVQRLFDRWNTNFREHLSEARKRTLILRRLDGVASRFADSADTMSFTVRQKQSASRARLALALRSIADQIESDPSGDVETIVGQWSKRD